LGNEAQARELAPLLRDEDEDAVVEVWHELRDEYGERLTAEKVRAAVERKLRPGVRARRAREEPLQIGTNSDGADALARAREVLSRAYDNAARLIADWLDDHPGEDLERVCRQIAPSSWQALEARVRKKAA
jgi:hypothetical protein